MNDITICMGYYENAGMLKAQCANFSSYPDQIKQHLRLIVVDDGTGAPKARPDGSLIESEQPSASEPAQWREIGFPFELYRMTLDIRWNQDACRNLAADRAQTDWLLLTDIDHILPVRTAAELVSNDFEQGRAYQFVRLALGPHRTLVPHQVHKNTWFLMRRFYWDVGGYDELLRGKYGTDRDIRRRIEQHCGGPVVLSWPICVVTRGTIPDASTRSYTRRDPNLDSDLGEILARRNALPDWRPLHFRTPWERVR